MTRNQLLAVLAAALVIVQMITSGAVTLLGIAVLLLAAIFIIR